MQIQGRLSQSNGRLRDANVGVSIEVKGNRLYLRATFPPRPGSDKSEPYQQRLALGYHANPAGLKLAETEARKIGALLDCGEFTWEPYLKETIKPQSVADWVQKYETDYFNRRERNAKSETTWRFDYMKVFSKLPPDEPLTVRLLRDTINSTKPDSRTRRRFVDVCSRLAKFAGLEADFKPLKGNYSPKRVVPRSLPADDLIAEWRSRIPHPQWQRIYGLLATYGLRPHEAFLAQFDHFPVLEVPEEAKTGYRKVYPFYPEWADSWDLVGELPQVTYRNNTDLGQRVSHAFKRYKVPFSAYDLRHAWAVRTIRFRLPDTLAARQMGHSVQVHTEIYHAWITEDEHQRMFDLLMQQRDRPIPPASTLSSPAESPKLSRSS